MPQLWKTSRLPERSAGTPSNGPRRPAAANLPPLIVNPATCSDSAQHRTNGAMFGDRSPVEPTSPTSPHYDQLLIELRLAQERRNRHKEQTSKDAPPAPPAKMPVPNGANLNDLHKADRMQQPNCATPSPTWPSPVTSIHTPATTKTGPKKVRFLEDGTGNLHTSVFGGSSDSLGSLLDSHQELQRVDETISIDALISSLANYEKRVNGMAKNTSSLQASPLVSAAKQNGVNGKSCASSVNCQAAKVAHLNGNTTNGHAHDVVNKPSIPPIPALKRLDEKDIRMPSVVLEILQSSPEPCTVDKVEIFDPHHRVQSFLDTFHCPSDGIGTADVIKSDPQNIVFHLEPDDPNSVDSGSVLSELDFEETSSTMTTESNKTGDSLNSPVNMNRTPPARHHPPPPPSRSDTSDLFAEVSDLLERSLQEIRRMEEDTVKIPEPEEKKAPEVPPPLLSRMPSSGSIREPLYELIGRKRTPPAQLCFRSNRTEPTAPAAPVPPPVQVDPIPAESIPADIWVPRTDWVPPSSGQNGASSNHSWVRRPSDMSWMVNGASVRSNNNNKNSSRPPFEEQSIYGRLWEAASSGVNSQPVNGSRDNSNKQLKQPGAQQQSKALEQQNQTVIRSMARKARLEHWRMAGMPTPEMNGTPEMIKSAAAAAVATSSSVCENGAHHNGSSSLDTSFHESPHTTPAFLSSLPLFQIPANQRGHENGTEGAKLLPKKLGFQLTWPPPPIPQSPCSSSASATPVTPTCPNFPPQLNNGDALNGHAKCSPNSPKCFGHDQTFQWPVPALPAKGSKIVQRSGSFKQETWTDSSSSASSDLGAGKKGYTPFQRSESLKEKRRSAKPANLDAAQDWYWIEEFPRGSGIEPGTGNMSTWFHGAISRSEAEARLVNQPTGAFLARLTERLWGYALSVKNATGHVSHFLIDAGEKWHAHTKYTLLGSPDPPQKTLRELIQFYSKRPLTPDGLEKLLFPCPQESAVRCSSRLK